MPRHDFKYDPALKEKQEWQCLYARWSKLRRKYNLCPDWQTAEGFYHWAMSAGFEPGDKFFIHNEQAVLGPDNCGWFSPNEESAFKRKDVKETIFAWNRAVNPLRIHFGLEPFPTQDRDDEQKEDKTSEIIQRRETCTCAGV